MVPLRGAIWGRPLASHNRSTSLLCLEIQGILLIAEKNHAPFGEREQNWAILFRGAIWGRPLASHNRSTSLLCLEIQGILLIAEKNHAPFGEREQNWAIIFNLAACRT